MKNTITCLAALMLLFAAVVSYHTPDVAAQAKGKTRPLTTSQMMAGLVKPKYVELKDTLSKEKLTAEDWAAVKLQAALLNESSYMMMADDRCPDEIWKKGSLILRKATTEVLAEAEEKNAAAALKAFEQVTQSCKTCHAEHKYKKQ